MDTVTKLFGVKPPVVFQPKGLKAVTCSNQSLVCGVELETEKAGMGQEWYQAHLNGAWKVDIDGSLRGRGDAFEFISKPITLEYLLPTLTEYFETTKFNETNYSDRCSVHVHTNVTDFTSEQLATLSLAYTVIEDVLFQFVNYYKAPTKEGYGRDTNIYCIPWSQCRANAMLVNNLLCLPAGHATHRWQKYTALNLLPITAQGTVEWRHMHGTADMEKLTIWLNIIGSIMKFAKEVSLEDVVKTVKVLNDTSAYQQFFNTLLQNYIPYDEVYRGPMADGVINAKNGLLNWEINKNLPKKDKASKYTTTTAGIAGAATQWAFLDEVRAPAAVEEAPVDPGAIRGGGPQFFRNVRGGGLADLQQAQPAAIWGDDPFLDEDRHAEALLQAERRHAEAVARVRQQAEDVRRGAPPVRNLVGRPVNPAAAIPRVRVRG